MRVVGGCKMSAKAKIHPAVHAFLSHRPHLTGDFTSSGARLYTYGIVIAHYSGERVTWDICPEIPIASGGGMIAEHIKLAREQMPQRGHRCRLCDGA